MPPSFANCSKVLTFCAGNRSEFARAVTLISGQVSFDANVSVSVFETNIRALGGLLAAALVADGRLRDRCALRAWAAGVCVCPEFFDAWLADGGGA